MKKNILKMILLLNIICNFCLAQKVNEEKLTPMQIEVMKKGATEPPFNNEYWDNKKPGIYVDRISGEALFSSLDQFDSVTGWPSFTKPIDEKFISKKNDFSLGEKRTEILGVHSKGHLGHVFDDGPKDKGGKRFCLNSAALKFIPLAEMEKKGYGKYLILFNGAVSQNTQKALLAGGCFWGVEDILRKIPGVLETQVGYTGGQTSNPIYAIVKGGKSGHAEAVEVIFDPQKISYEKILEFFFRLHDPTTLNQQGNDKGSQYRSAIFYYNQEQKLMAEKVKQKVNSSKKWKKSLVTEITQATNFYKAEEYHQDYLIKNPQGYTCHWLRD